MDNSTDTGRISPCLSTSPSDVGDNQSIVIKRKTSRSLSSTISSSDLLINTSPIVPANSAPNQNYDPAKIRSIERSNFLNLSILITKHILDSAMKKNQILDAGEVPLVNLFTILEGILNHGLRNKKTFLGVELPQKDVFSVLEIVNSLNSEACQMSASVKELPHVKTSIGRTRAWLRLAFMSKKLSEYFFILTENKSALREYYSDGAFMLNDDSSILAGHMTGLTIVDCNNWCARDEDLDKMPSVIDLKPYIRSSLSLNESLDSMSINEDELSNSSKSSIQVVLDQKNYLEAVNRKLQDQLESLTKGQSTSKPSSVESNDLAAPASENGIDSRFKTLVNELDSVTHVKNEMETALKLLEKDVHEKQDTIITLRKQLDDVKAINIQMYHKMKQHESDLKDRESKLVKSEHKLTSCYKQISTLELRIKGMEEKKTALEQTNQENVQQIEEKNLKTTNMESELRSEREKRSQLKKIIDDQQAKITKLNSQVEEMQQNLIDYTRLKKEFGLLQKKCSEYELSLEEMGAQLRDSKLEAHDLRETSTHLKDAFWMKDSEATECFTCEKPFSVSRRKHHCRNCGRIFCATCSDNKMPLASSDKPVRVCDACHNILLERYSVK